MVWRKTLACFGLFAALWIGGCKDSSGPGEAESGPGTVPVQGSVELPSGVSPSSVKIISGLNTGRMRNNGYEIKLNEGAVQAVMAVDGAGTPVLLSVLPTTMSAAELSARSTALALVFLNPFLVTSVPQEAAAMMARIEQTVAFSSLRQLVTSQMAAGSFSISDTNGELLEALGAVYVEMQGPSALASPSVDLVSGISPTFAMNGITPRNVTEAAGSVSLSLRNARKRWLTVYADPSIDGRAYPPSGELWNMLDVIPSPNISIPSLILNAVRGDLPATVTSDSKTLQIPTAGYHSVAIKAYGLGAAHGISDEELSRAIFPATMSLTFDIGIPLFEVLAGIPLTAELRGRPLEHPLIHLAKAAAVRFLADNVKKQQWYRWLREGNLVAILVDGIGLLVETVANDPRALADLLSQASGRVVARTLVNSWLWPIRVASGTITAVNTGYALASALSTEAVTTFVYAPSASGAGVQGSGQVRAPGVSTSSPIAGATITAYGELGNQLGAAQSNASGQYSLQLPAGRIRLRAVADGYRPVDQFIDVSAGVGSTFTIPTIWMTRYSSAPGAVTGTVRDATTLSALAGASVVVRFGVDEPGAEIIASTTTSAAGAYSIGNLPQGTHTAYITKSGYLQATRVIPVTGGSTTMGLDVFLVPNISTTSGYRIVLTWGANPSDLDAHLYTPTVNGLPYHIYYSRKGSLTAAPYAALDVDDRNGYGPETVTIAQSYPGQYSYGVHHFAGSGSLPTSDARVTLYGTSGLIGTWSVPLAGSGTYWNVFHLNAITGAVSSINTITAAPTASAFALSDLPAK